MLVDGQLVLEDLVALVAGELPVGGPLLLVDDPGGGVGRKFCSIFEGF